jgi:acetyltransferase-like isoleucine patch superfamily enzyme
MKKYLKILRKLSYFNFKTIYFNIKYLPFNQAIKLPILISKKVYLRKVLGEIKIECPVKTGIIQFGYGNVGIFDDKKSRSIWEVSGTIIFKGKANIGHGSKISVGDSAILTIGENFITTAETSIVASNEIKIGNDCLFSWDILIMDTDSHHLRENNGKIINSPKPIVIGNRVWLGCRSLILKGTIIPNNCVIGAESLVNKKLEKENCLYAGNPCKEIKEYINWEL